MVVAAEPPTRVAYPLPWNTTSTLGAATNREYFYDYAGQDPINNYDLPGTKTCGAACGGTVGCYIGANGFCVTEGVIDDCNTRCVVKNVVIFVGPAKLYKSLEEAGVFAKLAAKYGDEIGVVADIVHTYGEAPDWMEEREKAAYTVLHMAGQSLDDWGRSAINWGRSAVNWGRSIWRP